MGNCVDRFMVFLAILVAVSVGGAGIALSQTLSLDDQSAMAVGEEVTFTLSIDNPSSGAVINTLGVDIDFDPMVLDLNKGMDGSSEVGITYTRGTLGEASYSFFLLVSNPDSRTIRVGGLNPAGGVQPGQSGELVQLHFTVASMADTMLTITPKDDVASFNVQNGQFTFHVNTAPTVMDDMGTTVEDEAVTIDVLVNDSDDDMDTLTITAVTQGAYGAVVNNNDGTVTYTPNAGYTGPDNFTYTVSDGMDGGTAMVRVTVTARPEPPNTAPTAADDTAMTDGDVAVTIDVLDNDSDSEGDTLTVTVVTQGGSGTVVNNNDGTVTYTPNAGYSGMDSFMYTVSDGELDATATVSVTVEAAEEPVEPVDPDPGDNGDSGGGGGGCTLNPGAPFDPILLSVLALFMGVHFVRRFARTQSLR